MTASVADPMMVRTVPTRSADDHLRVEIYSNLSMTLSRLAAFFLLLSAVTLLVALWPTLMGYWPILVIAIIHLLIVGWCFRLAWRGNWARERIDMGPELTVVEQHALRHHRRTEWLTPWLRVTIERRGPEPRLFIGSHGRRQELGSFVPATERLEAARILESGIRRHSAWNPEINEKVSSE